MARRRTYIYRVEIGDPPFLTDFCYARNSKIAIEGIRPLYPAQSRFRTVPVGENKDGILFQKIEGAELEYLRLHYGKIGEKYTYKASNPIDWSDLLKKGTFVPKEALHEGNLL